MKRYAGHLPEDFWPKQESELNKLLALRVPHYPGSVYGEMFSLLFFNKQLKTTLGTNNPEVVKLCQSMHDSIVEHADRFVAFQNEIDDAGKPNNLGAFIAGDIISRVAELYAKQFRTLGDCLTEAWRLNIMAVVQRAGKLKKQAPPEVLAAYKAKDFQTVRDWLESVATLGLASTPKYLMVYVFDYVGPSFQLLFEQLKDALAKQATSGEDDIYREFDMNGLKVVIDDTTVTPAQTRQYVKYIDEAYNRFRAKGMGKIWYGTLFISCKACGGVNNLNPELGTAAHYNIPKDWVRIFERPGAEITEYIAHELGHRYWFKKMSQSQRTKFEQLIRVYDRPHPKLAPDRLDIKQLDSALVSMRDLATKLYFELEGHLKVFMKTRIARPKAIAQFTKLFEQEVKKYDAGLREIISDLSTLALVREYEKAEGWKSKAKMDEVLQQLTQAVSDLNIRTLPEEDFKALREKWVWYAASRAENAKLFLFSYLSGASVYIEKEQRRVELDRLHEREEAFLADPRPVIPVSDYGKNNAAEAFAEVFAWYIMGKDLTSDQKDSFRAVLAGSTLAQRIAALWRRKHGH
jgi:hypothetical protein